MREKVKNLFVGVRKIVAPGIICMLLFAVIGCESAKEPTAIDEIDDYDNTEQFTALKGTTWKLVGIVDAKTGTLRELEPKHCAKCYTLTFETDRIFFVRSIEDVFKMDLDNPFSGIWDILWCEEYAGNHYCDSQDFRNTVAGAKSYSVTDEELRLYVYGNPAEGLIWYSLFKRIDL